MSLSLARRERLALCDLALEVGPDAPTLCDGWDAADLVAHLLVREREPIAAAGVALRPLAGLTDRAMERRRRGDFGEAVERLRRPGFLYALPPVDRTLNALEFLVHHEDLRRGAPGWSPRVLPPADLDEVFSQLRRGSALLGRRLPSPAVLRRSDTGEQAVLRKGPAPVTITGPVVELALFVFGRSATTELTLDGPPDAVRAVRTADLGM
jgi:uncharacterized protein (TIGR03085 family)